jgi:hypothetical protein
MLTFSPLWAPPREENLEEILKRAGQRIQVYFEGLFSIACTEKLTRQTLDEKLGPKGPAEEFSYDYIVLNEPENGGSSSLARAYREPKLVNGKPAAPEKRSRIPDPAPVYTEPLMFLLGRHQSGYDFSLDGYTYLDGRRLIAVAFCPKSSVKPEVKWDGSSFRVTHVGVKGRVLLDPEDYEVVQLETQLVAPFEFRRPALERHGPFYIFRSAPKLRLERSDTTIRYQPVHFENPGLWLGLPVRSENLTVIRGASVPLLLTTQSFTGYKRFMTSVRIKLP